MQSSHLLVQSLGEHVHVRLGTTGVLVVVTVGPELDLSKNLVGERVGHDEAWVAGGTSEVHEAALGEQNDVASVGHRVAVDLGLDLDVLHGVGLEPVHLNLGIEVANVADDGVLAHLGEVLRGDDIIVTGGGDEDVSSVSDIFHTDHLVAFHSRLQGVDGVHFRHDDASTKVAESGRAAFANITIAAHTGRLASNHHIGGTLDSIDKGLAAAIEVVELALGHTVVDVDDGDGQRALLKALVQVLHTGRGLLRDTDDLGDELRVLVHHQIGHITTIIEDHVREAVSAESLECLVHAPFILFLRLSLPGEHRHASLGNSRSRIVLSGEDIAGRPAHFSAEGTEGLNQHSSLHSHVQAAGNLGTLQRLGRSVLAAKLHQAGHFVLAHLNSLTAPFSEADVLNLVVRHGLKRVVRG